METTAQNEGIEQSRTALAGLATLGIAYVLAGLGLFYGLAMDSMQIFNAALLAILLLLAVSMFIIVRNEPFITRENAVISACVFVAVALYLGLSTFTTLPFVVLIGVLLVVGVIVPGLLLQYGPSIVN